MPLERLRVCLTGAVQGVGFRPFVFRVATELSLSGWVLNDGAGLVIEVDGRPEDLERFLLRLDNERPPAAIVLTREISHLTAGDFRRFEILPSDESAGRTTAVLPDLATCPECLADLRDPANRRSGYPFTNCTNCGPRYTIVLDIPYDRPNTTMRSFALCPECGREYLDPADRRFHAQPNACPVCGPHVWTSPEEEGAAKGDALPVVKKAAMALAEGRVVALKGIGGFQLLVDARDEAAVERLRRLKHREEKPFALMVPDLDAVRECCELSAAEESMLVSSAAPIVLLRPRNGIPIARSVAKSSPYLGVMLPYSRSITC